MKKPNFSNFSGKDLGKRIRDRFRGPAEQGHVRVEDPLKNVGNAYYREVGRHFKTAQVLLFVLLFLVFSVFALAFSESITYRNLYYFVRDFRTAVDNTDAAGDGLAYEIDENADFAVFKGGLAVAGRERIQILTAAGGLNTSATLKLADPALSATTDLLLVYGRGETTCHIYNSFTKIHTDEVDGRIRSAFLSESGAYSVTTEDAEYESAVSVYSRNFQKITKYRLNSYAIAAPLSFDGKTVAILSYTVEGGVYETRLRLAEVGTDRVYCDYTVEGEIPLGACFTGNDRVLVLTENGLHTVTKKDGGARTADLSAETVTFFSVDASGLALAARSALGETTVRRFSEDGELMTEHPVKGNLRDLETHGEVAFYRTDTEIVRLSSDGTASALPCPLYGGDLLAVSDDRAALCFAGEAKYYRFED